MYQSYPTAIFTNEDGDQYLLGSVFRPDDDNTNLDDYWDEWQENHPEPETDSEFVDWLISEKGWKQAEVDCHVILN